MFGADKKDMKIGMKRFLAFTLVEMIMVFIIMGFIAIAISKISKVQLNFAQKCSYYAAFMNLKRIVGETIAGGSSGVNITQAQIDAAQAATAAALTAYNNTPDTIEQPPPNIGSQYCYARTECVNAYNDALAKDEAWETLTWCGTVNNTYSGYWAFANTTSFQCICPMLRGGHGVGYFNFMPDYNWTAYYQDFPSQVSFDAAYQAAKAAYDTAMQTLSNIMNTPLNPGDPPTIVHNPAKDTAWNDYLAKKAISDSLGTTPRSIKTLPDKGYVGDGSGLSEKFASMLNLMGNITIDATTPGSPTDFSSLTPNFTSTNGAKYYNLGATHTTSASSNPSEEIYTIYIDIDGTKGKSKLNEDVMKFTVDRTGLVLPAVDSKGATDTKYLSASIKYKNASGVISWIARDIPYQQAACSVGDILDTTYCGSYTKLPACSVANTTCTTIVNVP